MFVQFVNCSPLFGGLFLRNAHENLFLYFIFFFFISSEKKPLFIPRGRELVVMKELIFPKRESQEFFYLKLYLLKSFDSYGYYFSGL